jgi:hypothetical protein
MKLGWGFAALAVAAVVLTGPATGPVREQAAAASALRLPAQVAGHPRLLIRAEDLPRLRSWASAGNPIYAKGLAVLARNARAAIDKGTVPREDGGSKEYEEYPTEWYAELFAFMSLVEPSARRRADYGRRARTLLMYVIDKALPGRGKPDEPFRDPEFSTSDRSRWQGEAFGLTVDWAYPYFSTRDKARTRTVFLRWAKEQFSAYPVDQLEGAVPTPGGRTEDPALLRNLKNVRWSLNNYYLAHARNLGLMALALDRRDDPGGTLRAYLRSVTGTWLFVVDHALRTAAAGGLAPEGFEYGPDAVGRLAQLLLALETSGSTGGLQRATIAGNPFWAQFPAALLQSLPPRPTRATGDDAYLGQIWQPAWFGSAEKYRAPDFITSLGPLALAAAARGDRKTVDAIRWIETNVPPGGKARLLARVGDTDQFLDTILYFLVFDPHAAPPADPRPRLPLTYFARGLNRILVRTCRCRDARMFTYALSWNAIDHQRGDGNDFGFYRDGEWLTKQRTGYSSGGSYTDYHNSVSIQNDAPEHNESDDPRHEVWLRGDQWVLNPAGDPRLLARSVGPGYVYALGDATNLYNSRYEGISDIVHASRSIVWLQPDHIVVYDRAATRTEGRFKRFWLQLPAAPGVSGRRTEVRTARGQQLFVTTLLPRDAQIEGQRDEDVGEPAVGEPMRYRLRVEAPGGPKAVRFLHVLQGASRGAAASPVTLLRSVEGSRFVGAAVAGRAVLFPVDANAAVSRLIVYVPTGLRRILVTGLRPGAAYRVTQTRAGRRVRLSLAAGGLTHANGGGVLVIRPGAIEAALTSARSRSGRAGGAG